jgi:hypothetical protein
VSEAVKEFHKRMGQQWCEGCPVTEPTEENDHCKRCLGEWAEQKNILIALWNSSSPSVRAEFASELCSRYSPLMCELIKERNICSARVRR